MAQILLFSLLLFFHGANSSYGPITRIQRFHNKDIAAKPGDIVKFEWKYDVDEKTRNEKIELFFCGYREKGSNIKDSPIIPLAISKSRDEFVDINSKRQISEFQDISKHDVIGLRNNVEAHVDRLSGNCVMEVKMLSIDKMHRVESFACELKYETKLTEERIIDGITNIIFPSNLQCNNAGKPKRTTIVRGSVFLGAILFDILLLAVLLSVSLIWNRKSKGYKPVATTTLHKKKHNLENGRGTKNKTRKNKGYFEPPIKNNNNNGTMKKQLNRKPPDCRKSSRIDDNLTKPPLPARIPQRETNKRSRSHISVVDK